jgi:Polyketide synthase modules and related proteins
MSTLKAAEITEVDADYWVEHVKSPVSFLPAMEALDKGGEVEVLFFDFPSFLSFFYSAAATPTKNSHPLCSHQRGSHRGACFRPGRAASHAGNNEVFLEMGASPILIGMGKRLGLSYEGEWVPSIDPKAK